MLNPYHDQPKVGWARLGVFWVLLTLIGLASANSLLTAASFFALAFIVKLLWRPGEPPVLLYAMAYHWVQACILTLNADLQGLPVASMEGSQFVEPAIWLTLAGVLVISIGMRVGAGNAKGTQTGTSVAMLSLQLSTKRLFIASLVAVLASQLLTSIAFSIAAIRQPILALTNLHWVVVFLFTYTVLAQRRGYRMLGVIFVLEILVGFLGFFSGFTSILIVMLLAALTAPHAFRGIRLRTALSISAVVICLALVWTSIKKDYRLFLNSGSGEQVVLEPTDQRIKKLGELVGNLSPQELWDSIETLSDRLTYVKFFGQCMQVVPSEIPYEQGLLWREALENSLVPRFLNPEKREIQDSERTSHYTGGFVAGVNEGASISLGYIAESYIDFGPVGMFLPLFLWGLFCGWIYRVLIQSSHFPLFGYACATVVIFFNASVLESSNQKMVGGMVLGFLALFIIQIFYSKRLIKLLLTPKF